MNITIRILTGALGLLGLAAAAAFWFNPDGTAQNFGLTLNGMIGQAVVRADLAGLFLSIGTFSLLAAIHQHGNYAKTALILTAAVFVGRLINFAVNGFAPALLPPIGIEVVMMAVYYAGARMWGATKS